MLTRKFQIKLKVGLHARPAAMFVQTCNHFDSEITVIKENATVNAKSIIGIMALAVADGDYIDVKVEGSDEQIAMKAIQHFFEEKMEHI